MVTVSEGESWINVMVREGGQARAREGEKLGLGKEGEK